MTKNLRPRLTASSLLLLGDTPVRENEDNSRQEVDRSHEDDDKGATEDTQE